jgi:hypothetical protein
MTIKMNTTYNNILRNALLNDVLFMDDLSDNFDRKWTRDARSDISEDIFNIFNNFSFNINGISLERDHDI